MKKKYFFWLVWFLFYVFVFAYLLQNSFSYLDPDLGWHLQVGKEIIGNNHAPVYEKYTYTLSGQTWVDHEWLFNVLIYWLFENFGFIPLSVFFSLLMIFTLALLAFYVIKYHVRSEKGVFLIMALQFFGLKAMAPHLGVRMQEITLLLLLVLLIILDRFEHTKKSKILAWLPPLFLVWANLHGSFLIGLTVLAFWLFFKLAVTIIARLTAGKDSTDHDLNRRNWRHSLFWCLGALAATFLNPYGLGLYDFLSGYADNYYSKHITEWLPFYYLSIQHNQLFYCALVAGIFCILSITRFLKKDFKDLKKIRFDLLWSYVLILFFLWLALKSKRHFPLFFIVSFPFTVKFFINHLNLPSNLAQTIKNSLLLRIYSVLGLVLLSIFFFVSAEYTNEPFTAEKYCLSYPCDGIDFVKGEPAYRDLKIFNNYSWGGFMIWVWPEKPLFIDGRLPQFDFAGHTILEEYHDFFKKEKTTGLLEKYGIEMVFIDQAKEYRFTWFEKYLLRLKNDDIKKINSDFLEYMNNADRWKLVYEDNICLIYAKI